MCIRDSIAVIEKMFVRECGWISHEELTELIGLTSSLPGPLSTKIIIAIGTMRLSSPLGGIISFLCFSGPAAIILVLCAAFLTQLDQDSIPPVYDNILKGLYCGAVAIVAQAGMILAKKMPPKKEYLTLIFVSAGIFIVSQRFLTMMLLLVFGALFSILFVKPENSQSPKKEASANKQVDVSKTYEKIPFIGKQSLIAFVAIFGVLYFFRWLTEWPIFLLMEGFYRIGSIIFGGGHVVLPMIVTHFGELGLLDQNQFMNGFLIVSFLPGPMFNISAYLGMVMKGPFAALYCYASMFAPGFLTMWGMLPYWLSLRKNPRVERALKGVSCISVGFVFSAIYMMWEHTTQPSPLHSISTICITLGVLLTYDPPAPFVIILGGVYRWILYCLGV
eukprot:TRINITY_DN7696_c0_g1_i2.p1 TRINITY_DN7696_c0_g1~~TRINITY_DN7696_c0_g1_i2.p1  ORF type:complete len:398 (+),score=54.40 TRINITY_DN7696_c0_g1_i2:27-1196(+)